MKFTAFLLWSFPIFLVKPQQYVKKYVSKSTEWNLETFMQKHQILLLFNVIFLTKIFLKGTCLKGPINGMLNNSCFLPVWFRFY